MNISYDYYRIFYYVAKYGSITQAAKYLLSNQPNLTRTIKNLESALGCTLFLRSNRGIKLTPEGEKLYSHVRIAFENIEIAENEIIGSRSLEHGCVSVAATEVALRCFLLPVLKKYRIAYPGIHLRIGNYSTPQAIEEIKKGVSDIAVVTASAVKESTLEHKRLAILREIAVCGTAFQNLIGRKISLSELSEYPLISLGTHTKTYEVYSEYFSKRNLSYTPDIEAATADQILPMVEADLGVGFVPEKLLNDEYAVSVIDLEEELPQMEICLIKRKGYIQSAAVNALEKFIIDASAL